MHFFSINGPEYSNTSHSLYLLGMQGQGPGTLTQGTFSTML